MNPYIEDPGSIPGLIDKYTLLFDKTILSFTHNTLPEMGNAVTAFFSDTGKFICDMWAKIAFEREILKNFFADMSDRINALSTSIKDVTASIVSIFDALKRNWKISLGIIPIPFGIRHLGRRWLAQEIPQPPLGTTDTTPEGPTTAMSMEGLEAIIGRVRGEEEPEGKEPAEAPKGSAYETIDWEDLSGAEQKSLDELRGLTDRLRSHITKKIDGKKDASEDEISGIIWDILENHKGIFYEGGTTVESTNILRSAIRTKRMIASIVTDILDNAGIEHAPISIKLISAIEDGKRNIEDILEIPQDQREKFQSIRKDVEVIADSKSEKTDAVRSLLGCYGIEIASLKPKQIKRIAKILNEGLITEERFGRIAGVLKIKNEDIDSLIKDDLFETAAKAIKGVISPRFQVQVHQQKGAEGLFEGYLVEILAGTGKTVTISMAAYLKALEGCGHNIYTHTEQTAFEGAVESAPMLNALGMVVGLIRDLRVEDYLDLKKTGVDDGGRRRFEIEFKGPYGESENPLESILLEIFSLEKDKGGRYRLMRNGDEKKKIYLPHDLEDDYVDYAGQIVEALLDSKQYRENPIACIKLAITIYKQFAYGKAKGKFWIGPGDKDGPAARFGADITYGYVDNIKFDYMRDRTASSRDEQVMRLECPLWGATADEADLIMGDRANEPAIISESEERSPDAIYGAYNKLVVRFLLQQQEVVKKLEGLAEGAFDRLEVKMGILKRPETLKRLAEILYKISIAQPNNTQVKRYLENPEILAAFRGCADIHESDKASKTQVADLLYYVEFGSGKVHFTEEGIKQLGEAGVLPDLNKAGKGSSTEIRYHDRLGRMEDMLIAHLIFTENIHYYVKDGEVRIIDESNNWTAKGRTWCELHRAVEAKHGQDTSQSQDTTYRLQSSTFFKLHRRLAGTTGTARRAAQLFYKLYGLAFKKVRLEGETESEDDVRYFDGTDDGTGSRRAAMENKRDAIVEEICGWNTGDYNGEFEHQSRPVVVASGSASESEDLAARLIAKATGRRYRLVDIDGSLSGYLVEKAKAANAALSEFSIEREQISAGDILTLEAELEGTSAVYLREEKRSERIGIVIRVLELKGEFAQQAAASILNKIESMPKGKRISEKIFDVGELLDNLTSGLSVDKKARARREILIALAKGRVDISNIGDFDIVDLSGLSKDEKELFVKHIAEAENKADFFFVMNARLEKTYDFIYEHMGRKGFVTISTNMIGRGTDIKVKEDANAAGGLRLLIANKNQKKAWDEQVQRRAGRLIGFREVSGRLIPIFANGSAITFVSLDEQLITEHGDKKKLNRVRVIVDKSKGEGRIRSFINEANEYFKETVVELVKIPIRILGFLVTFFTIRQHYLERGEYAQASDTLKRSFGGIFKPLLNLIGEIHARLTGKSITYEGELTGKRARRAARGLFDGAQKKAEERLNSQTTEISELSEVTDGYLREIPKKKKGFLGRLLERIMGKPEKYTFDRIKEMFLKGDWDAIKKFALVRLNFLIDDNEREIKEVNRELWLLKMARAASSTIKFIRGGKKGLAITSIAFVTAYLLAYTNIPSLVLIGSAAAVVTVLLLYRKAVSGILKTKGVRDLFTAASITLTAFTVLFIFHLPAAWVIVAEAVLISGAIFYSSFNYARRIKKGTVKILAIISSFALTGLAIFVITQLQLAMSISIGMFVLSVIVLVPFIRYARHVSGLEVYEEISKGADEGAIEKRIEERKKQLQEALGLLEIRRNVLREAAESAVSLEDDEVAEILEIVDVTTMQFIHVAEQKRRAMPFQYGERSQKEWYKREVKGEFERLMMEGDPKRGTIGLHDIIANKVFGITDRISERVREREVERLVGDGVVVDIVERIVLEMQRQLGESGSVNPGYEGWAKEVLTKLLPFGGAIPIMVLVGLAGRLENEPEGSIDVKREIATLIVNERIEAMKRIQEAQFKRQQAAEQKKDEEAATSEGEAEELEAALAPLGANLTEWGERTARAIDASKDAAPAERSPWSRRGTIAKLGGLAMIATMYAPRVLDAAEDA
ncbi:MAG: hypothetical protein HQ575_04890, partial [Candidatus Omnitrophica bacterium]|nr:hypothetical protein [Candidatus Omnitrophota bacterium]